jgi:hypothetical protein
MALGEIIAEFGFRFLFEVVFYGITYWTGVVILKAVSLGSIRVAPFWTLGRESRGRFVDCTNTSSRRVLSVETVCLIGMVVWILLGVLMFFVFRAE